MCPTLSLRIEHRIETFRSSLEGSAVPPMSITHQAASKPQIALVPPEVTGSAEAGRALIVGPFPPLIGPAAGHASALLHLFKETGYTVRSATGPGLALARHALNFASETRLRNSAEFLSECQDDDFAVIYAKSFDFAKVSKPYWYKRRLEELRRLRLLVRIVRTFRSTTVVLDGTPFLSRSQLSLWAVARLTGALTRKDVRICRQKDEVCEIFEGLTGLKRPQPTAYRAEDTAYEAAFNPDGPTQMARLTIGRAEQALNFWTGRTKDRTNSKMAQDIRELIKLAQRHDLHSLPHFQLLWNAPDGGNYGADAVALPKSFGAANELLNAKDSFGVPVTRFMKHLWGSFGPNRRFKIRSASDAERLLDWYLFEAPAYVPAKAVPIPGPVRSHYLTKMSGPGYAGDAPNLDVVHARGRDEKPFALSSYLAALANSDHPLARKYDVEDPLERLGFVIEFLLTECGENRGNDQIGASAAGYLSAPIGGETQNVSRLEFLLALHGRCQLDSRNSVESPWSDEAIGRFVSDHCLSVFPAIRSMLRPLKKVPPPLPYFAVSGLPRSETGVGSNLHMSVSALADIGVDPQIFDTADGMRHLPSEGRPKKGLILKKPVALHHVNADLVPQSMLAPVFGRSPDMLHIGFLLWEFDKLPQSHKLALDLLDEIWAPTDFLKDTYASACKKPVRTMYKGLHLPEVPAFDLSSLGIGVECTTFLTCFDFHSSVARKNPLAAVQAFKNAFPKSQRDVRLIVKTTPSVSGHWGDPENQMRKIRQLASADPRIKVVAEYYPFNQLLSLIASCDCLISPHRAEGFGLMPAYALGMGRAVIATDYSGTTDFCTPETAFPIPFAKVEVERHQVLHPLRSAKWAEIDRDALIAQMRRFVSDPTDGIGRAAIGRDLIKSRYAPAAQSERYKARLTELGVI